MNNIPGLRRLAPIVAAVLGLQLLYVFCFVFPGHDPKPNGLRLGLVTDSPTQVATAREQVEPVLPGADYRTYETAAAARHGVEEREIYGAVVFDGEREQVLTAPAASFTVASALQQSAVRAHAQPVEVVPLSAGDPRGLTFNLLIVPLVVTGLLAAQFAVALLGSGPVRRRLMDIAIVSALGGLGVATLVGPILGALPGALLLVAAAVALSIYGLLTIGSGLIRILGPAGLGLGFALFLMIGNPASGAASAPDLLPSPWAEVGPFLVPGALTSALRAICYFDGAGVVWPAVVLGVTALIGTALELFANQRTTPVAAS